MKPKHKIILEASKKLLLVDLTCWNVVEEILNDVYEAGRKSDKNESQKKPIEQYCKITGDYIETFPSIADATSTLGIPRSTLIDNLKGRTKFCKGFIFKYVSDEKAKKREVSV